MATQIFSFLITDFISFFREQWGTLQNDWTIDWTVDWTRDDHYQLKFDVLRIKYNVEPACWLATELARSQDSGNSCFLQCARTTVQLVIFSGGL